MKDINRSERNETYSKASTERNQTEQHLKITRKSILWCYVHIYLLHFKQRKVYFLDPYRSNLKGDLAVAQPLQSSPWIRLTPPNFCPYPCLASKSISAKPAPKGFLCVFPLNDSICILLLLGNFHFYKQPCLSIHEASACSTQFKSPQWISDKCQEQFWELNIYRLCSGL